MCGKRVRQAVGQACICMYVSLHMYVCTYIVNLVNRSGREFARKEIVANLGGSCREVDRKLHRPDHKFHSVNHCGTHIQGANPT